MTDRERMEELISLLNKASEAYYNDKDEIMSNYEWDSFFDELSSLEAKTGIILEDSPTQKTGAEEEIGNGGRERHEFPALSLAKSKDVTVLQKWAGNRDIWLSWKLDGLTLVLTYDHGKLTRIMTRGNGTVGTNISYFADYIDGIPKTIEDMGHLVVRGEAAISYDDFEQINAAITDLDEQYANPRNLVAGTLGLDVSRANLVKERKVCLHAFTLVYTTQEIVSWGERMNYLEKLGFIVVDREKTNAETLPTTIDQWTKRVKDGEMNLPVDGLVITYDDTEYAATGSVTGHHATNAGMAFKWADTAAETVLDHVEWSCAAFAISPVAVFKPVHLEGTEVKRASLCNISEMKRLGIGADGVTTLQVIKSNMIIPKCIAADAHGTDFTIPTTCPVCGHPTEVLVSEKTGTETLHCINPECMAKHIQKYSRFVSKSGMDIDGLSEMSLRRFINEGFITDFADIYDIQTHRDAIVELEGFGEKSFQNLIDSIEKSRKNDPVHFIYALCIPMIGVDAAKKIIAAYGTEGFLRRLESGEGFEQVDGIGVEKSGSIVAWYQDDNNKALFEKLLQKIELEQVEAKGESDGGTCQGLTFVITGDVHIYKNRDEFKAYVESQGGKVTGSVSKKTNYLINNDVASTSGKNQKAKELGIPILSEDEFVERFA